MESTLALSSVCVFCAPVSSASSVFSRRSEKSAEPTNPPSTTEGSSQQPKTMKISDTFRERSLSQRRRILFLPT